MPPNPKPCCRPVRYADGPKYYSEPKLVSFELAPYSSPDVTAGLANAPDFSQGELLALHIASLSHQLQQFYAGAAVAAVLGRTLVLPTFQCYCYRDPGSSPGGPRQLSWSSSGSSSSSSVDGKPGTGGWACRAPGDDNSALPFNCTLDQVRGLGQEHAEQGGQFTSACGQATVVDGSD
jgi:hypothetical protein